MAPLVCRISCSGLRATHLLHKHNSLKKNRDLVLILELKGPRLILDDLLSLKIRAAPKKRAIHISLKKTHNKDEGKTSARFQTRVESSSYSLAAEYVAMANFHAGCSRQEQAKATALHPDRT